MESRVSLIRPFAALRPAAPYAAQVAAPPYDVLSSAEARLQAAGRPWSFLHISKPEIDLPPETDPYSPQVYSRATENLRRMIEQGVLLRDPTRCFYAYRIIMGQHAQTGVVGAASIADYDSNRIRKHELTRPDKEDDRVRQIEALDAQTGPVLVAHPPAPEVDALLARVTRTEPTADVTAANGVRHTIWVIGQQDAIARITAAFDAMPAIYIADGHHRSAAASRVAAIRKARNARHTGEESYNFFLTVAFPHHQMQILPYNRVVSDLNGLSPERFLSRLEERFDIGPSAQPVAPARPGEFGLYLPGAWYRLSSRAAGTKDPVARLDVSVLADQLLAPVLGISDPRTDKRIDFVGGIRGLGELEKRVNEAATGCAFSLFPTRMEDLMAVADAGRIMPPKSTWFEPKLADGLVSHVLD
jgi:uncharacterized protein (DUF1015 family)